MRGGRPCLQAPEIEEIQEGDCPVTEHRMRGIEEEGGFRLKPWDLPLVKPCRSPGSKQVGFVEEIPPQIVDPAVHVDTHRARPREGDFRTVVVDELESFGAETFEKRPAVRVSNEDIKIPRHVLDRLDVLDDEEFDSDALRGVGEGVEARLQADDPVVLRLPS